MIEAKNFVGKLEGFRTIPYKNEYLYNVLLETQEKIIVNNIICESLSPYNIVSLIYTSKYSENEKNNIIKKINKIVKNGDVNQYRKMGKKLFANK
jgi:hypothetical protein